VGCPTLSDDVTNAVLRLLTAKAMGIYHFRNEGHCSRLEQARTILQLYGLNNSVEAVKNDALFATARRPAFSVLDIARYAQLTGHTPRSWQESTAEYINYLKANKDELGS
jgi:dTDP-4-dehydrorhamnose reductase